MKRSKTLGTGTPAKKPSEPAASSRVSQPWAFVVAALLAAFISLAVTWQIRNRCDHWALAECLLRGERLAGMTNILERSGDFFTASAVGWNAALVLPAETRIFRRCWIGTLTTLPSARHWGLPSPSKAAWPKGIAT